MNKYEKLRNIWITLRKNKDKSEEDIILQKVIGLIIDKVSKLAKVDKSEDLNKYLDQAIKGEYKQTLDSFSKGVKCETELNILKDMLPKTLSEEETTGIVTAILARSDKPNIGLIMNELRKTPGIDMKLASGLVKKLL
jgi:uncharacterized protein YqeY